MNTKEISNGMSYNEVKNMFGQVMEQLEDLGNKQPSSVEVDLTPMTEKLNRILNKPEVRDFTEEQKTFLMDLLGSLLAQVAKRFPIYTKLNEIGATVKGLSESNQSKKVINEHRIAFDFADKSGLAVMTMMFLLVIFLTSALYFATQPDYDRIDNDLKYRYILMKGDAPTERINELEDTFRHNRDNTKIRQMKKDVEAYERAVLEGAANAEQTRLRTLEAERLRNKAQTLKEK